MTYVAVPREEEGGITKVLVNDMSIRELMAETLLTLKKIELHLQSLSGEEIEEGDI